MTDHPSHDTLVTPPKDTSLRPAGILVCHFCRNQMECDAPSLLGFTRSGWPKCCDEVMTLYKQAEPPLTDDTKIG